MKLLSTLRRRFAAFLQREKLDAELDEELRFHLERQAEVNVQAGMSPEDARYAALRQFGWAENIKQAVREQHGFTWSRMRQRIEREKSACVSPLAPLRVMSHSSVCGAEHG